jgi:SAM-dependent methyltransferase
MERSEWLKKMRLQAEALYDRLAPLYWVRFGILDYPEHDRFVTELLGRLAPDSCLLDAACGAGRYDGRLEEAGHRVLGVDQSARILARARGHYPHEAHPRLRYKRLGLQELDFQAEFEGVLCVDALEHVPPEDYPGVLSRLARALKPGGVLYFTVDCDPSEDLDTAYRQAREKGLPVVPGELVDELEEAYARVMVLDRREISGEGSDAAVYHFYPDLEQVRRWLDEAGLSLELEGRGDGYAHFLAVKPTTE